MTTFGLFAGVDCSDAIRFVADVARGNACGCFCPGCGSALVAKRGDINAWHFAHEAKQERPECLIGAVNLLRRMALELLQQAPRIELPAYVAYLEAGKFPRVVRRQVHLHPRASSVIKWHKSPAQRAEAARFHTESGAEVVMYVDVASQLNRRDVDLPAGFGEVHFLVPMPDYGQLRSLAEAVEHINSSGYFSWIYLPDLSGEVEAAQKQVESEAAELEKLHLLDIEAAEKVHREIRSVRGFGSPQHSPHIVARSPRVQNPEANASTPWASWRKPNTTFMFYGLRDQSGWMIITHQDGRPVAVPWPIFDGWDESLPVRLGVADLGLGGIPLAKFEDMMSYVRDKQVATHFSTTWQDILDMKWP